MGEPRLLLEAASSYRSDLEDRRTELLAVALHEHLGFRRQLLKAIDLRWTPTTVDVRTQQTFPSDSGPVRIDLILDARDQGLGKHAVVFIELKYNPDASPNARWFDLRQGERQRIALDRQYPCDDRYLTTIVSDCDRNNHRRPIPEQYAPVLTWRDIAELAYRAGGQVGWEEKARAPSAAASQRVLLEFWRYLKGDPVGAIEDDDLAALGLLHRAMDRIEVLLQRVSEEMDETDWDQEVSDDWITSGDSQAVYIAGPAPENSWVAERRDGGSYVVVSFAEWDDESPLGEPQLYAGTGFSAKREEQHLVKSSDWPVLVAEAGLTPVFDPDGIFVFGRWPLREVVRSGATLTQQVNEVVSWAKVTIAKAVAVSAAPRLDPELTKQRERTPRAKSAKR